LTLEAVEVILSEVLKETKDKGPVLERARIMFPSLLDLALDLPSQTVYGKELYQTIWEKAAVSACSRRSM